MALQELWEASAPWDSVEHVWPMYHEEVLRTRAERAAWDGWSTGEDQQPPQVPTGIDTTDSRAESPYCQDLLWGRCQRGSGKQPPRSRPALLTLSPPWQRFDETRAWAPRPPAQPRRQQAGRRWRKAEGPIPSNQMGTASKLVLQAE